MSCDFQSVERYELPYCSNPKNTAIDVETDVEQRWFTPECQNCIWYRDQDFLEPN